MVDNSRGSFRVSGLHIFRAFCRNGEYFADTSEQSSSQRAGTEQHPVIVKVGSVGACGHFPLIPESKSGETGGGVSEPHTIKDGIAGRHIMASRHAADDNRRAHHIDGLEQTFEPPAR